MIMANNINTTNPSSGSQQLSTGEIKKELQSVPTTLPTSTSQTTNNLSITHNLEIKSEITITKPVPQPTYLSNSDSRWIFPLDKIEQSPSRLAGVTRENELLERQEAALFINDLGIKLKVNQLCINTAIIYMHRFFMIHSLKKFHHYIVATSCLFFACKVEEQPRRLREFIDIVQSLFHKSNEPINHNSEEYRHYGEQIMALESCLIQTLGFNVLINHAHTVIIKTCQMIKAPRDLAEAAYLTATNSLILTDFCVKFSSEKVACFCIYLACKWTGLIIPMSSEGMQWYEYVNHDIKEQELEDISKEYLAIYGKCSNKIKKKLGITKNQDEINPQLQPKHLGPAMQRKPMNSSQQQRPSNPNQVPPPNVNKQHPVNQQKIVSNNPQSQQHHNGHYPPPQQQNAQAQQQNQNNYHYVNAQHQQQRPPQQHQQRASSNPKQINQTLQNNPNLSSTSQPAQKPHTQPKANNPNSTSNRYSYPNGSSQPSSTTTSQVHQTGNNLNSQPGAASSTTTKSNINVNNNSFNNNPPPNIGQGLKKPTKQEPHNNSGSSNNNHNPYKQQQPNGNHPNTNPSLNLLNTSRPSPVNTGMKRGNEEISNNVSTAPNKIPKYVIDQKSAS